MTLQLPEPTKYYFTQGFYWMVSGDQLIQFTDSFFNQWHPGTNLHGCKKRELSAMKPINDSLGVYVMNQLLEKIRSYVPVSETV